jgi:MFS family permease
MSLSYFQAIRRFETDVWLFYGFWLTIGVSYFGIYAVVFNLYLVRLGYGPEFIGLVQGFVFLGLSVFCIPAGWLGKRFGPRRMLIVGTGLSIPFYTAIPLSEIIPSAYRAAWIFLSYGSLGVTFSLIVVNSIPFLMGLTGEEERSHAFSVLNSVRRLSGFAGNLLAGILPGLISVALGVSLNDPPVLCCVQLILLLFTRKQKVVKQEKTEVKQSKAPIQLIVLFSVINLLWIAGTWSTRTFFNVYMDTDLMASTALIGALVAVGQLLSGLAALLSPFLVKSLGRFRTLVLVFLGFALSQALLAFIPLWAIAGFGFIGVYALFGIAQPVFVVYSQESITPEWRPVMAGYNSMAWGAGTSALVFGGGYVVAAYGYSSLFSIGMIMAAASALIFFYYFRTPRGEYARISSQNTGE